MEHSTVGGHSFSFTLTDLIPSLRLHDAGNKSGIWCYSIMFMPTHSAHVQGKGVWPIASCSSAGMEAALTSSRTVGDVI